MLVRKRRVLSATEIKLLLEESDSSSDFDSDVESSSDSDVQDNEDGADSDDSRDTIDYDVNSTFAWTEYDAFDRARLPFTGTKGLQVPISDTEDVLAYFNLYLTEDIIAHMVEETNRRAQQLGQDPALKRRSRQHNWVDTTPDELRVFMALLLYQGIMHKPDIKIYWTTKPLFETPYVRKIMAQNRFLLLWKCLHFTDNTSVTTYLTPAHKSFAKIKWFYEKLVERFSAVYIPEQNVAIDKSLMLWKGRLAMKQYIPLKRARFGLKSYELCESSSGYIWKSFITWVEEWSCRIHLMV